MDLKCCTIHKCLGHHFWISVTKTIGILGDFSNFIGVLEELGIKFRHYFFRYF